MTDADALYSLADHETAELEQLRAALRQHASTARLDEDMIASASLRGSLSPLLGQHMWLVCALVEAVLSERTSNLQAPRSHIFAAKTVAASPPNLSPVLVWSGATSPRSCARTTRETIEDLFSATQREVFIAGYSFDSASDLFLPLAAKARALLAQNQALPAVRVVLDCSRKKAMSPDEPPESIARRVCSDFLQTCWRDMPISPDIRYLRASAERTSDNFAKTSMHAKCIVVDKRTALVGSANFSNRGRDRNIEVGAVISDYHFVQSLCAEWDSLWPKLSLLA